MAVVVLVLMRKLVSLVYYKSNGRTKISEDSLQDLLRKFERSFIKGAISGVCMASTATGPLIVSFAGYVTLLSCYVFFCCCDRGNDDDDEVHEQASEEDLHIRSSDGYRNCMVV
jgi:hypothetical protein